MLNCALVSSDEGFRHAAVGIIRQPAAQAQLCLDLSITAGRLNREALDKILDAELNVVFLDLGQDPAGVGGIQALSQEAPEISLIVAGPALSADGLLAIMRAGATEYLPRPISQEEILEAFLRVRRRRKSTSPSSEKSLGQVTTVFSAKGGAGVTTVATNLASALSILTDKTVLILDLASAMGTVSVAMGVHARYSYLDVIRNFHRIDDQLFRSFLEAHESGIQILSSPMTPLENEPATGEDIRGLVGICRQHFDFVVVDGGTSISSNLLATLQESDHRMMVVTPELPSLRNLKQALDLFVSMNGRPPPKLVLNNYKEGVGLSSGDVEDGLGQRLSAIIERDEARVPRSINLGRPEVLAGRSKFVKNLMELGSGLVEPDDLVSSKEGFLNRLFRSSKGAELSGKETK